MATPLESGPCPNLDPVGDKPVNLMACPNLLPPPPAEEQTKADSMKLGNALGGLQESDSSTFDPRLWHLVAVGDKFFEEKNHIKIIVTS